ncbi:unnamed protein product [Darwinula stevensoni]|uniref:Methylmalonic aciduria and homocystinuria type D protein n=1 Tax=Darwinula stevensoni TaxID=69355 RepID=A0A7R9A5W8_9CRUS|nr:unnamed protein product [Darwinula stevensoni]CAG0886173.1 unnamed protein product [Darwinula stevensoni]
MCSLVASPQQLVAYHRSLQTALQSVRSFSSQGSRKKDPRGNQLSNSREGEGGLVSKTQLGLIGPQEHSFPLPGNIGFDHQLRSRTFKDSWSSSRCVQPLQLLSALTNHDRHLQAVRDFLESPVPMEVVPESKPMQPDSLECAAQECPKLLRKEFNDLFPDRNLKQGTLSLVTLSQKTLNDMSSWSSAVEEEREKLTSTFVDLAQELCSQLHSEGYWADFIDPSSGRPYLGAYTNATLFETDERFRHLGFEIEDLGCCKVISHHRWATHVFVGCIFTNAPLDHPVMQQLLQKDGAAKC